MLATKHYPLIRNHLTDRLLRLSTRVTFIAIQNPGLGSLVRWHSLWGANLPKIFAPNTITFAFLSTLSTVSGIQNLLVLSMIYFKSIRITPCAALLG